MEKKQHKIREKTTHFQTAEFHFFFFVVVDTRTHIHQTLVSVCVLVVQVMKHTIAAPHSCSWFVLLKILKDEEEEQNLTHNYPENKKYINKSEQSAGTFCENAKDNWCRWEQERSYHKFNMRELVMALT